jgi:Autographiviridae RNA polymerase
MRVVDAAEWERLLRKQEELEDSAYTEGAARFKKQLAKVAEKGAASQFGAARRLLRNGILKMEQAISGMCEAPQGRGLGKRHVAARWCKLAGPDVAAYLTLKVALDQLGHRTTLSKMALMVTDLLLDELRYRRFREKAPHLFQYKLSNFHTSSYSHMARSMNASMRFAEIDCTDLTMPKTQKLLVGLKLLDILMDCTGIIETYNVTKPGKRVKTEKFVRTTEATDTWLATHNGVLELQQPAVLPMVVPPLPWGREQRGGYRYALRSGSRFGMVRRISDEMAQRINDANIPIVYEALNTLQNTAWRVNRDVLSAVEEMTRIGGEVAGLPATFDKPEPPKPYDIETNEEARKVWKKSAEAVRVSNNSVRQQRVALDKALSAARKLQDEAAIFFPYSLDFRGRLYPVASYLTPQGDDLSRSLLTFADGKAIDADGAMWLAVHGANCLGSYDGKKVSRMTLTERKQLTHSLSKVICKVGEDPLGTLAWWTAAEKPLQFLAFCFEWRNLVLANDAGREYVSSLPVSMDGSCNGIQHFSALLLDEVGGAAVNLVPGDAPQDIYSLVAEAVLRHLTREAAEGNEVAALWLGLHAKIGIVDRKLTKRPTMTFGYGSKQFGFNEQIAEYVKAHADYPVIAAHFTREEDEVARSVLLASYNLMARMVWLALSETVVAAFAGMDWMQRATRGITVENQQVEWTVPLTGFPVRQEYFVLERQEVNTILAGKVIRPRVYNATDRINKRKQANAVAPNFIHSLDAAALMLTVEAAFAEGVECFSMIHDSYGTLAGDCSVLARCCRQSFVRLYQSNNVVQELYEQLKVQWKRPEDCPAPPRKGQLDVSMVLGSTYFFS